MSHLARDLEEAERRLEELRQRQAEFVALQPAQQLATILHKGMCHRNHTDECGWEYDRWSIDGRDTGIRKEYLEKAERVLAVVDFETAKRVAAALFER